MSHIMKGFESEYAELERRWKAYELSDADFSSLAGNLEIKYGLSDLHRREDGS